MIIQLIDKHTRVLGAGQGFLALPVRDELRDYHAPGLLGEGTGGPARVSVMVSEWLPSPEELAALAAGASILLEVWGRGHPPVMIKVGEPKEVADAVPAVSG